MSFQQSPPGPGGAFLTLPPIWHPPVSSVWMVSFALVVAAVNLNALPSQVVSFTANPLGFFATILIGLSAYDSGYPQASFAILFFLLMAWSHTRNTESFNPSGTVDWVTNSKRWFVEVVLKEKPIAIQEKTTNTYPIQGGNSVPSS
jgi:hypothetical protein